MRKISKKRAKETPEYNRVCKEIRDDPALRFCIFCLRPVNLPGEIHHLEGRDGDLYAEKENLFLSHHDCHHHYHHSTVEVLLRFNWYLNFVRRLEDINFRVHMKEINRLDKSNIEYKL
ncbi:MAG: hypothetical protein ACEPOW_13925 [Bacteroidales bacterium]